MLTMSIYNNTGLKELFKPMTEIEEAEETVNSLTQTLEDGAAEYSRIQVKLIKQAGINRSNRRELQKARNHLRHLKVAKDLEEQQAREATEALRVAREKKQADLAGLLKSVREGDRVVAQFKNPDTGVHYSYDGIVTATVTRTPNGSLSASYILKGDRLHLRQCLIQASGKPGDHLVQLLTLFKN